MQFSVRARYEWNVSAYRPFVQVGATHSGHSYTQAGSNPAARGPAADQHRPAALREPGLHDLRCLHAAWPRMPGTCNLYGENLSNSNKSVFVSTDQFIVAQTPLRPRVIGGAFGYKF